jgi:hypothetical protein
MTMKYRVLKPFLFSGFSLLMGVALSALPERPSWPLTLREGLPTSLPGWTPAPGDPLPEEGENEMGKYTEVARFFQRIEGSSSAKQFRVAVQDYGAGRDLTEPIRKAFAEASGAPNIQALEVELGGVKAFVITDRSGPRPTTLVTAVVRPSRLVLGQGANVASEEAIGLVRRVDFAKVAAAK